VIISVSCPFRENDGTELRTLTELSTYCDNINITSALFDLTRLYYMILCKKFVYTENDVYFLIYRYYIIDNTIYKCTKLNSA